MTPSGNIDRRQFIKRIASASALAAVSRLPLAHGEDLPDAPVTRPNILLIVSDEHNSNVFGPSGNGIIKTPNLDRLAKEGIVFDNCYCNSPLCVPSRLSFLSGKYISEVGAWSNNCWLPSDDVSSLPSLLNSAGYESFLCGKMHLDATRRYGYTEIGDPFTNRYRKAGTGARRPPDDLEPLPGISSRFKSFHPGNESRGLTHDAGVTGRAVDFIRWRKPTDKPFLLTVGYYSPHYPLIVPIEYWWNYEGKVPMPVIPDGHVDSQPLNYKHLRLGFNVENAPDETVRRGRELYYGLTQWLDEQIGKVIDAVQESAIFENTIVIYASDHGEMMGEHGLWWKNAMYEHAARVPLVVSWPSRWNGGQRRKEVCSLLDLNATIVDLAGANPPRDWRGDSMLNWLDHPDAEWKDFAISEYYAHYVASGYAMIRTGDYKYVYHTPPDETHPSQHELYNLKEDPREFRNLASLYDSRKIVSTLFDHLVGQLGEHPDKTERRCREDLATPYDRGNG